MWKETRKTQFFFLASTFYELAQFNSSRSNFYLAPVLLSTMMLTGFDVVLLMPAPVGAAVAERETEPRFAGRQLQVTE
jgi:hypothetical protein